MIMHVTTLAFIVNKQNKLDLTRFNPDTSVIRTAEHILCGLTKN